jgi:hypothetical protein
MSRALSVSSAVLSCGAVVAVLLGCGGGPKPSVTPEPIRRSVVRGDKTELTIDLLSYPQYNGDSGASHLTLTLLADSSEVYSERLAGNWHCLGYNAFAGAYVLAGEFQVGAWLPLRRIRYLHEEGLELQESRFHSEDWLAFAAVPSQDLEHVVFVGGKQSVNTLFALHTATDRIVDLAVAPPSPAPLDSIGAKEFAEVQGTERWGWELFDGYTSMDEGVIVFEGDSLLRVSYGDDTAFGRGEDRTTKEWRLSAVFSRD